MGLLSIFNIALNANLITVSVYLLLQESSPKLIRGLQSTRHIYYLLPVPSRFCSGKVGRLSLHCRYILGTLVLKNIRMYTNHNNLHT